MFSGPVPLIAMLAHTPLLGEWYRLRPMVRAYHALYGGLEGRRVLDYFLGSQATVAEHAEEFGFYKLLRAPRREALERLVDITNAQFAFSRCFVLGEYVCHSCGNAFEILCIQSLLSLDTADVARQRGHATKLGDGLVYGSSGRCRLDPCIYSQPIIGVHSD